MSKVEELSDEQFFTCAIVRGELIYMVQHSHRKSENEIKVNAFLEDIIVLPIDDAVADIYGKLKEIMISKLAPRVSRMSPRKIRLAELGLTDHDLWIAAVAIYKGLIVVTRDSDFQTISRAFGGPKHESWLTS